MVFSNPIHPKADPGHFERIAKNLRAKRLAKDYSSCDVKIQLSNGDYDMVHSMVVCTHSTVLSEIFGSQRAPYQPFNMKDYDGSSVKRVIDWMYTGEIDIPEEKMADVLRVVSFLRLTMLQNQIEQKIRDLIDGGSPIMALNIATNREVSVLDETKNELINELNEKLSGLSIEEISKLTLNSIVAIMSSVIPMKKKIPFINMLILWIMEKKPERDQINAIIQSLVISDITLDALYSIRFTLKQHLTNLDNASKTKLSISPSGTVQIQISTKKAVENPTKCQRTRSEISEIGALPNPFKCHGNMKNFHTASEMEVIKNIPDPFNSSKSLKTPLIQSTSSSVLVRETSSGFPKCFTRSEVENLQQMTDPFAIKSDKGSTHPPISPVHRGFNKPNCTAKFPGWSNDIIKRNKEIESRRKQQKPHYTPSEIQMVRDIPDPFQSSDPVIMSPVVGKRISTPSRGSSNKFNDSNKMEFIGRSAQQSFSGQSMNNNNPNQESRNRLAPIISSMSVVSPNPVTSKSEVNKMTGIKKTDSEIQEIKSLPSFHSDSFYTAKTSQHSNVFKPKEQKSQQYQNKNPRSQYLWPK